MMILTHGDKCECGKEFDTEGTLIPNIKDREFYGGRVNFFKEVTCDCGKEYVLCIEKKFDALEGFGLKIIDMIDVTKENPLETFKGLVRPKKEEKVSKVVDTSEHVLTKVVSRELQVETLKLRTMKELQTLCKEKKVSWRVTDSKAKLIDKLLEADPSLVVANPKEG